MANKKPVKPTWLQLFLMAVTRFLTVPVSKIKMGYRCSRKEKEPDTPTIVISNHNSWFDPVLFMAGFSRYSYFVASEHSFRMGFSSKVMEFVYNPIPFNKVQTDFLAMKEILLRIKAGNNVTIFAEGNRSYNGVTADITLSIAKVVKMSGANLMTYRFEGLYFTTPRWAHTVRKGKAMGRVTGRYSAQEIKPMTTEQVLEIIKQGIHEDAYARQRENPIRYKGKNRAEHIEIVLYLCPACNSIATIHSKGNNFSCNCGMRAYYTETGFLEGEITPGQKLPFSTITEWDKWQAEQLAAIVNDAGDVPICRDDKQRLFKVVSTMKTAFVGEGAMQISRTEFRCAGTVFPLDEIKGFEILGRMILSFALKDGSQYEVYSAHPRSALKYAEVFRALMEK